MNRPPLPLFDPMSTLFAGVAVALFALSYGAGTFLHRELYTLEDPGLTSGRFYRGNVHMHTNASDGDTPPAEAVRWYREHGYQFVFVTEHHHRSHVEEYASEARADFLVLPGEELTMGIRRRPAHVGVLGLTQTILSPQADTAPEILQAMVTAAREAGALPIINHPNYRTPFTLEELRHISGWNLMEVANAHPGVNNQGGKGVMSTEQLWDGLLTDGRRVFGVASDDTHHFGPPEPGRTQVGPGFAWVMVSAPQLTGPEILKALSKGRFYASTGVTLRSIQVSTRTLSLDIRGMGPQVTFLTTFRTAGGRVLAEVAGTTPQFTVQSRMPYVRATVVASNGAKAYVQPVFLRAANPAENP